MNMFAGSWNSIWPQEQTTPPREAQNDHIANATRRTLTKISFEAFSLSLRPDVVGLGGLVEIHLTPQITSYGGFIADFGLRSENRPRNEKEPRPPCVKGK